MNVGIDINGNRVWKPTDPNDAALLKIAEGSTFFKTIFPSGWKSPPSYLVAKDGMLVELKEVAL